MKNREAREEDILGTKIFFIDNEKDERLDFLAKEVRSSQLIVFPTETVYGIGCNGLDEKAVEKLFQVKKRPRDKAISLHVSSLEMIEDLVEDLSQLDRALIKKFMPGPISLIFKKKSHVPDILTAGRDSLAIRMPDHDICRALINKAGVALAGTSANISGHPSGKSGQEAFENLKGLVGYIIDSGPSKYRIESTVVDLSGEDIKILREGKIKAEEILSFIEEFTR